MAKLQLLALLVIVLLNVKTLNAEPEFHNVLKNSPHLYDRLLRNQLHEQADEKDGILYERRLPGGKVEKTLEEVLQETLQKYDSRFAEGVSAYWTFQIRIARFNSGEWRTYAKSLPRGIQTIKVRYSALWQSERTMGWTGIKKIKVLVY